MDIIAYIVAGWLGLGAIFALISFRDMPGSKWGGFVIVMFLWPIALVPWHKFGAD